MLRHVLAHAFREYDTPDHMHCVVSIDMRAPGVKPIYGAADANPESKDQLPSTCVNDIVHGEINGEQPRVRTHIASFVATYWAHNRTAPSE